MPAGLSWWVTCPLAVTKRPPQEAVKNAVRMMKEGNMDAVKLEGIPASDLSCSKLQ